MATKFTYTPDSPVGRLQQTTAAALAEGLIPQRCPHPAAVTSLRLHQQVLLCGECAAATSADLGPRACAACGAPDGCLWFNWFDVPARVVVTARVCPRCMKDGNVSLAAN